MSGFNDEDLKQLKGQSETENDYIGWTNIRTDRFKALLSRLESAEKIAGDAVKNRYGRICDRKAWLLSKGGAGK